MTLDGSLRDRAWWHPSEERRIYSVDRTQKKKVRKATTEKIPAPRITAKQMKEDYNSCWKIEELERAHGPDGITIFDILELNISFNDIRWAACAVLPPKDILLFAINEVESVLHLMPGGEDRPRQAVAAARICAENPSDENKQAAKLAASGAYAVGCTVGCAAYDVACAAACDTSYVAYAHRAAAAASSVGFRNQKQRQALLEIAEKHYMQNESEDKDDT